MDVVKLRKIHTFHTSGFQTKTHFASLCHVFGVYLRGLYWRTTQCNNPSKHCFSTMTLVGDISMPLFAAGYVIIHNDKEFKKQGISCNNATT